MMKKKMKTPNIRFSKGLETEVQNALRREADSFARRMLGGSDSNIEIVRHALTKITVPPYVRISEMALIAPNGDIVKRVPLSAIRELVPQDELHIHFTYVCE